MGQAEERLWRAGDRMGKGGGGASC